MKKFKVCLDYHIGKCLGPCEDLQSEKDYNKQIDEVRAILSGKIKHVFLISEIIKLADFLRTGIVLPLIYTF